MLFSSCIVCDTVKYIESAKPHFQTYRFKVTIFVGWNWKLGKREKEMALKCWIKSPYPQMEFSCMFPQKSIRISAKCIHLVTLVDILIHLDIWDPPPLFTNGNLLYISSNFDSIKKDINPKSIYFLFTFLCIYGSISLGRGKWSKCGIFFIFFWALLWLNSLILFNFSQLFWRNFSAEV